MKKIKLSFQEINNSAPWFSHVKVFYEDFCNSDNWIEQANVFSSQQNLKNYLGHNINFQYQSSSVSQFDYEEKIFFSGKILSRNNFHDFFNMLIWLNFPKIKKSINYIQFLQFNNKNSKMIKGKRSLQSDAATLFDENGVILVSYDSLLIDLIISRDWKKALFKNKYNFFKYTQVYIFGHSLFEKLISPYKSITGHLWIFRVSKDWFNLDPEERKKNIDKNISKKLIDGFSQKDFYHLPILGIPGWSNNQNLEFYEDKRVFRP